MATQAQIDANLRNAQLSTGPKSPPGKCKSRANSLKHGGSGRGIVLVDPEHHAEALRRKARWTEEIRPASLTGRYAIDRAVAMSLRVENCENALDALFVEQSNRARHDWEHTRRTEALDVARGLAKDPEVVSHRLQQTPQGVALMVERWGYLARSLELGAWDESDRAHALDLLGVGHDFRKPGQTPLDAPEGVDASAHVREAIDREVARLRARSETILKPADALEREHAASALGVLRSKPAALLLRYEREAAGRLRAALRTAYATPEDYDPTPLDPGPEPEPTTDRPDPLGQPLPTDEPPATGPVASRIVGESRVRLAAMMRGPAAAAMAVRPADLRTPGLPNRRARRAEAARLRRSA